MKSQNLQKILRLLLICAGAGAGAALAYLCVQIHRMTTVDSALKFGTLALLYGGMGGLGALLGHVLSPRAIDWWEGMMASLEKHMDSLSMAQLAAMVAGLVTGLLVAALTSRVLDFLGDSMFTLAASATLYVVLGAMGLSIGKRRTEDFSAMLSHLHLSRERKTSRRSSLPAKLLDATVLQDGRLEAVHRTGFLEGELLVPDFVLDDMHEAVVSSDPTRQLKGRRALNTVEKLHAVLRVLPTESTMPQERDAQMLSVARQHNAVLMTGDQTLCRTARTAGVPVLNLNDLACAMRTTVATGDVLALVLTKTGKEPEQGVGYLDDGTMVVVEGGSSHVGQSVEITVTSVLQTSAGRMVFAKL